MSDDLTYTQRVEALANELGIEISVAMDIEYLRGLEARILRAVKANPKLRDFLVQNRDLEAQLDQIEAPTPKPMILHCPKCGMKHIDEGEWASVRRHKSHLCMGCGEIWRPFDFHTVGVAFEVADLVMHASRPDSYGFVDRIEGETYYVRWLQLSGCIPGTPVTPSSANREWAEGEPHKREELVATECPGCGEPQCWCGVGR